MRAAQKRGLVNLPNEVITRPVTANPDADRTLSQSAVAPVGTTAAELEAILDRDRTIDTTTDSPGSG